MATDADITAADANVMLMLVHCSDRYRAEDGTDSLERMKPEDVYDSIRRTTADIRHYVKMESNSASPPSPRTSSQRRNGSGAGTGSYQLPVVRSPDKRGRQRHNQVSCRYHVYLLFIIVFGALSLLVERQKWHPVCKKPAVLIPRDPDYRGLALEK